MGSEYMEFGFNSGDDRLGGGKFERFKGKEGETYRLSFVSWPLVDGKLNLDAESPRFIGAKRFYIENVGYFLDNGPEFAKLANGPSKATIATIIAQWPLDRKGNVDKARFLDGDVEVKPWIYSRAIYDQLKHLHSEWSLGKVDASIRCTDSKFQKMELFPCKENLFRKALESDSEKMQSMIHEIAGKVAEIEAGLKGMIAQDLTLDKLREKLRAAGGSPVGGGGSSGSTSSGDSTNVESLLDEILSE